MVQSIENEVVNNEPEHSHGMAENIVENVVIVEGVVHSNEGEVLIDDAKHVIFSEVDQNMMAEPADKNLCLSEKLANDGELHGKDNIDKIIEGGDQEFSGCNDMGDLVCDKDVIGKNTEAIACKGVSPISTVNVGPVLAEEHAGIEVVKADASNGNISHVAPETIAGWSRETVERNGETQTGVSSEAGMAITDGKICAELPPIHEEPVEVLGNATESISISQQTEISDLGKVQEKKNGFASSGNDFPDPVSSQTKDADQQIGQNVESVGELCEQANETISFHAVDFVATASSQSVEASEHIVEVQGCSNDFEMLYSTEVPEEPEELVPEISLSQSEDDDDDDEQIGSVSDLQQKANDSENDPVSDAGKSLRREKNSKRASSRSGSMAKEYRAVYELPPEPADEFSVNDLVWGKVKSHPWWPGQIFDPSDSSEKAMKYQRKDCYLVAYFGDKTFAWNDASQLKPFRAHFTQEEKQSSSEAFQNAIDCALEEVSRRVELGLACSCIPEETFDNIKFQIVENAGIQTDSSKREGGDEYINVECFHPDKLVDYVGSLAQLPTSGANQLDLTIAKAQLLSFYRVKGRHSLPEVQFFEGSLENNVGTSPPQINSLPSQYEHPDSVDATDVSYTVRSKGPKRKHNLKDIVYHRRKEKSFSEIMGESLYYYDEDYDSDEKVDGMLNSPKASRKRKASNFLDEEPMAPESTKTISVAKVSHTATPSSRRSFKIGDCIRRVASQLTGSSSTIKSTDDGNKQEVEHKPDKSIDTPEDNTHEDPQNEDVAISTELTEERTPDDFLWQLSLTAQYPMRAHGFSKSVVSFFSEIRDAAVSAQRKSKGKSSSARGGSGRKRKSSVHLSPESYEFDDRKDSYWADMVVENNSEEKQPARRTHKRKDRQLEAGDPKKLKKSTQKRQSRKQKDNGNPEVNVEQSSADEVKQELPTELVLNFGDTCSVPSIADLNRMFRRFGPLKESETEVDKENSRARVVFKNGADAEIAHSSAATFNIFGSGTVSYQLSQAPPISSHSSAPASAQCTEDAA